MIERISRPERSNNNIEAIQVRTNAFGHTSFLRSCLAQLIEISHQIYLRMCGLLYAEVNFMLSSYDKRYKQDLTNTWSVRELNKYIMKYRYNIQVKGC